MLNQLVLVGRAVKKPELKEAENGSKYCYITLAVPRSYKNKDGQYDSDFIECSLWDSVAITTNKYCDKGDIVGVRGRLQTRSVGEGEDKRWLLEVIGEKLTFLSEKKKQTDGNLEQQGETDFEI